jgi:glycosyltransferase involved in cell wall biosynthesis
MQEGSIYAMTSATECFPMALLEAQAAGMAIISYDCPNGPRNIITNKVNGLLVENQSIDAFAKELKQLILNPFQQKEIQLKAQESITQFSEGQVMKIWDALFKSIIK